MIDSRNQKLAKIIVHHSLALKKGEKVLIQGTGTCTESLIEAIIREAHEAGAHPLYRMENERLKRAWLFNASPEPMQLLAKLDCELMRSIDAYVGVTAPLNALELSDIPRSQINLYQQHYSQPVQSIRVPHTRWVVLRYPTHAMAQSAGMSLEAFEDFYYQVCTLDYQKMSRAMEPLKELMDKTDRVRLTGPGTDLRFSIAHIPSIPCGGTFNLPDGEIFTAPVRESAEGTIRYNCPSVLDGFSYSDIEFHFQKGRIVKASANDTGRINETLDRDEGARYLGEFALGVNPYVNRCIGNTLFDEKIWGSLHLTPGQCYDEASNGNKSSLHWDLVLRQDAPSGGGEVWFDDQLIRKDGLFLPRDLQKLNPDKLS